ncbi:MAG: hypothetical protein K2H95_07525 [Bacteroidales bacterium]|nr:hypothetical protein [Bacteroidales bacterium]MDE5955572.1 hypothetical protein [Bacteroidales bacterium]MDE6148210.1 hypothetical protein [Bacteroidales bacterium]
MDEQKLKKIMYALVAVAVVLAGVLAYIWYDKYTVEKELESEKNDLIGQLNTLNNDYASLSSDYEDVNLQLDSSRLEVQLLIEKLTKTEATNRAKIRQYEKELGTLRTVMRGYVKQIDSLHSLNKQLTADAARARQEAAENRRRSEELTKTVENLSGQVAAGAVIKARGLKAEAYNASNKATDRSSRVKYLLTTLSLVENDLAEKGPVTVYIRIKDPEGVLLLNDSQKTFNYQGTVMISSASREVDYQGAEVEMGIYLNDIQEYAKGIYTIEAYTADAFLGSTELMLR